MTARLVPLALALLATTAPAQQDPGAVRERFESLDAAGDLEGVVVLWRANPGEVLYTIDADLEEGLALWEADPVASAAETAALHARAQRGALAADRAFGRAVFSDYAAAFTGWGDVDRRRFRVGQRAYDAARDAIEAADWELGLRRAEESRAIAEDLGDWWGCAMACTAAGSALERLERPDEALRQQARARLLFQQLGLAGSELRNLVAMARLLVDLDRTPRARVTIERGLALALELGVPQARVELLRARAALEQLTGELEAAKATLLELRALLEELGADG